MTEILEILAMIMTFIIGAALYWFLMKFILPKHILKIRFCGNGNLGRGIKKLVTENDRAVVCEPHPSIRKYIKQYAVFTSSGFKNLICKVDGAISSLQYSVYMFNNKNKLIDVLSVKESIAKTNRTHSVILHHDTSYVAIELDAVDEKVFNNSSKRYYRGLDILLYALSVFVISFLEFIFTSFALSSLLQSLSWAESYLLVTPGLFIAPSLIISVCSLLLSLWHGDKEGIKVVLNDRKY